MKTKEAIELVDCYFCKVISADEGKGIISLLQQGEKYKKIVREISNRRLFSEFKEVQQAIKDIKQKYLKEAKQDEADNK